MQCEVIELDSPRVKNIALKQYFCLSYFVMMFVKLWDRLKSDEQERSLFIDSDHRHISEIFIPLKTEAAGKSRSATPTSNVIKSGSGRGYLKETISTSIRKLLAKS